MTSIATERDAAPGFAADQLPAIIERPRSRVLGILMIGFALVWGGFPLQGFIQSWPEPLHDPGMFLVLLFPVAGGGLALFGLHTLLARETIAVDRDDVTVTRAGLWGAHCFRAPRASYRGVRLRTCRIRRGKRSVEGFAVDLLHPERDKTLNLYRSARAERARARWEALARSLDLPALEDSAEGPVSRNVQDLDKSLADMLSEGKLSVDYERLGQRAEGIAVEFEDDVIAVTRTAPKYPVWLALAVALFPLVAVFLAVGLEHGIGTFLWAALPFEALFAGPFAWDYVSRERLRAGRDEVRISAVTPWFETRGRRVAMTAVETVHLVRSGRERTTSLAIATDRRVLRFGARLPHETLEFLCQLLLAKVAEGPSAERAA